jgi:hypothetical protein
MDKIDPPAILQEIAQAAGGTINECVALPDGSGFATMSMPLPKDHWSTAKKTEYEAPPMRWRMEEGACLTAIIPGHPNRVYTREAVADLIREAGKYAYRSATMGGQEPDLDPDALLQNLVVAFLGYWSPDGRTDDEWALPLYERGKRA